MDLRDQKFYIVKRSEKRCIQEFKTNDLSVKMFSSPFDNTTTDYYYFSELILRDYFDGDLVVVANYAGDFSSILLNRWSRGNERNKPFKICGITMKEYLNHIDSKKNEL